MNGENTPAKSRKTLLKIAGIAAVIVAALIIFQSVRVGRTPAPSDTESTVPLKVEKTEVPASQNPERFPSDIPIEASANIVQNYNAEAEDGRYQATRVFETSRTLAANYTLYSDFFSKNGWEVVATVDEPMIKVVSAKKDNVRAQVTISENSVTKVRTVDISVTYLP